jgi:hypothetical protein
MYGTIFVHAKSSVRVRVSIKSSGFESFLQFAVIETKIANFFILSSEHIKNIPLRFTYCQVKFMYLRTGTYVNS